MKKLLIMFGAVGLSAIAGATVVACKKPSKENKTELKTKKQTNVESPEKNGNSEAKVDKEKITSQVLELTKIRNAIKDGKELLAKDLNNTTAEFIEVDDALAEATDTLEAAETDSAGLTQEYIDNNVKELEEAIANYQNAFGKN